MSKIKGHKKPFKASFWLVGLVIVLWYEVIYTGFRLPYLYTSFSCNLRLFFLFPLMLGVGLYFAFIYKKGKHRTGYMQSISSLKTRAEKIKFTVIGLFGMILITGGIAWTSIAFSAWAAKLFSREFFFEDFKIVEIKARSGAKWSAFFDIELRDTGTGEVKMLQLNKVWFDEFHWKENEYICLAGRRSLFGASIQRQSRGACGIAGPK